MGLWCWITPIRMLVAWAVPRKLNMPTTVMIETTANDRLRNKSSRSRGERARRSAKTSSTMNTVAMMNAPTTEGEAQPSSKPLDHRVDKSEQAHEDGELATPVQ